jgi:P-type E1-E2 ATPase
VPIAIMSGISRAARRGILIKDGATLEALAGAKQLFLDKTGTLTSGHARLQSVEVNGQVDPQHLLGWPLRWHRPRCTPSPRPSSTQRAGSDCRSAPRKRLKKARAPGCVG